MGEAGDALNPLTHHEILQRIGPFTRRGRLVDLSATDRLQRRIVFKSIDHPESLNAPRLRESLTLDDLGGGSYRLTRVLTPEAGPGASLEASGAEPAELLARVDEVPPQRQFRSAGAVLIGVSYQVPPGPGANAGSLIFTRAAAQFAGVDFTLDAATVQRGPAKVNLERSPGDPLRLPQDALAVLGGQWSRLRDSGDGWSAELRLPGKEPRRSRLAESAIETSVRHLAGMLAEPPGRFHERWTAARWGVFCRRLAPLALCVGLILCAAAVPRLHLAQNSGLRMLILNSPPILMVLCFCLREIPVVEIPPLPRRSLAASWRARPVQG